MKPRVFDWSFLIAGWVVQVVVFMLAPTHPLSLVSGLLGITSVILCSQGKILTFVFGFGQIITYTYLCWLERFLFPVADLRHLRMAQTDAHARVGGSRQ